jgi:NADPH:quinone reductase
MLPASMQFISHGEGGGPEALRTALGSLPTVGPNDVLIKVDFAGINRADLLQREGKYPLPPGASPILGLEVAGSIVALGNDVTAWKVGDQVCALTQGGGYAEYCRTHASHCLPSPRGLGLSEAAAIPETFFTVWTNLIDRGRLANGDHVLIHGGSSGIGYTAIQIAKKFGAKVFTTVGDSRKAAFCAGLGADYVINYREQDFVAEIRKILGSRGIDIVLDMVGGSYIEKNIDLLAIEGRLINIAYLQGSIVSRFDWMPVMLRRLTVTGSTLRPRSVEDKAAIAQALWQHVWPLLESGQIKVFVYRIFDWTDVAEAHRVMQRSEHTGKIVLRCGSR